jgi:glycerophosphoryl diester phosphodiesterase
VLCACDIGAAARALARLLVLAALVCAPLPALAFDLQGHRGARGLAPENTLAAFRRALAIGVTTIETDVALTRDGRLVIAHDPLLNPDLARGADGRWLDGPGPAIRTLTLAEVQAYDVGRLRPGSRYAGQWPEQTAADGERMPALEALFALVKAQGRSVRLNIETKIRPDRPEETADAALFARAVVEAVQAAGLSGQVTIQSFDWRTLRIARQLAPGIETACLTIETERTDNVRGLDGKPSAWTAGLDLAAHGGSVPRLVQAAGCSTWSPFWRNVTAERVGEAQAAGLRTVPWTVNDPAVMAQLIDLGVDGLITDYPDRARRTMASKGLALP